MAMEEAQQKLLHITSEESLENGIGNIESSSLSSNNNNNNEYKWWIQVSIFTFFTLFGGVSSILFITSYYDKGGKSVWLAALMQNATFPFLLPFLFYSTISKHSQNQKIEMLHSKAVYNKPLWSASSRNPAHSGSLMHRAALFFSQNQNITTIIKQKEDHQEPHVFIIILNYTGLGALLALVYMLNATGLQYLPVSTYSLITATQLGFNALFSFFLNSQKLTPGIVNCLVLLTASSVICVFQNDSGDDDSAGSSSNTSRKFFFGFLSTIAGSATYQLQLCLTKFSIQKVLKTKDFIGIIEMSIFQTLVATIVLLIGLFLSGDLINLSREMAEYKLGKVSYVIILILITITTAVYIVASTGLVFKVTSLFYNAVINLSAPITPVFSVILLHDKMGGLKMVSLFLVLWGFASYIYQQYVDDHEQQQANDELEDYSGDS